MAVAYGKGAKAKATKLHSVLVRQRGRCARCGSPDPTKLQCAHIISRRYSNTRVLLENAWCLCASCHFTVDAFADEKMTLVARTIGMAEYHRLRDLATRTTKVDWQAELDRLREVAEVSA
jgi:5-methylcytosine-specific restriction endonuclease McrA